MTDGNLTPEEENQKKYYDKIADAYDEHHFNDYALKYRYDLFDHILRGIRLKDLQILDAMCGGGQSTRYFIEKEAKVTGIDISPQQCARYRVRFPEVDIVCGSILDTEFDDNTFDFVVTDSLHHLHPELDKGIKEILRILKPNGYFLFWEPTTKSLIDWLRKLWYRLDKIYFAENEQSVDLDELIIKYDKHLKLVKGKYGGNVAYLLVQESLLFRMPPGMIKFYASPLMVMEKILSVFQSRLTSCWVLALMQKN